MEEATAKKAWYKKWWVWAIVAVVVIGVASNKRDKTNSSLPTSDVSLKGQIVAMKIPQGFNEASKLLREINLPLMSKGFGMKFGISSSKGDHANATVTFISNDSVSLKYINNWAKNGDPNVMRSDVEVGTYQVKRLSSSEVMSDNKYWPCYDSVIVLLNNNYGYDNGYKVLPKGFLIAKSQSENKKETQLRLYQWLDPVNYPSRHQEYTWRSSLNLTEITK